MKLINKTNANFLKLILVSFPIICLSLYFSINYFIANEVDEKLRVDELRIIQKLEKNSAFISIAPIIEVKKIKVKTTSSTQFENKMIFDPIENENEPYRELASEKLVNGSWYSIKVRHSTIESKDLLIAITFTLGIILALWIMIIYYFNKKLTLKLWEPFYQNINQLKAFSFSKNSSLKLSDSDVDEFHDLKNSLTLLTNKLQKDYLTLKEFTENASHEIQTPLSIIAINLDEVLQEDLNTSVHKKLYASFQSTIRLSKLNEKLLLLAKLDNDQFNDKTIINLNNLMTEKIAELKPLIEENILTFSLINKGNLNIFMDSVLANILITNILSNTIKYAIPSTIITVEITAKALQITNETKSTIAEAIIFERFKKDENASKSTGLGLSIVKKITDLSNLKIEASNKNGTFKIKIALKK